MTLQTSNLRAHPYIAIVLLIAVFSVLWPYSVHNRNEREHAGTDLKSVVAGSGADIEKGYMPRRLAIAALGLLSFVLVYQARQRGPLVRPGGVDKKVAVPAVLFVAYAAASTLWADDPALAARRIVVFLGVCFAAWAVSRAWRLPDILLFILIGCGCTLMLSVLVEIHNHAFTPFDGAYRLSGLTHPNTHAVECIMLMLASLAAARLTPSRRRLYLGIAGVAAVLLLSTRSRTAVVSVAAAIACASYFVLPRRKSMGLAATMVAAALIIGVFFIKPFDSARGAMLMGRTQSRGADVATLSGRLQLWRELFGYVKLRPIAGYGFDSFWSPSHTASVSMAVKWAVPEAHSGYLDTTLSLGVIGLVLFCLLLAAGLWHALRRLKANRNDIEALFTFTVLTWLAVETLSETVIPQTHYGAFLVLVLLAREAMGAAPSRVPVRARAPVERIAVPA